MMMMMTTMAMMTVTMTTRTMMTATMTTRTMVMMRMKKMVIKRVVTIFQAFIGDNRSNLFCTA